MDNAPLIEGLDYYVENGFWVFTAHYLRNRGFCCDSDCRHCPYGLQSKVNAVQSSGPTVTSEPGA